MRKSEAVEQLEDSLIDSHLDGCTKAREGTPKPRDLAESGRCLPTPMVADVISPPKGLATRPCTVYDDLTTRKHCCQPAENPANCSGITYISRGRVVIEHKYSVGQLDETSRYSSVAFVSFATWKLWPPFH